MKQPWKEILTIVVVFAVAVVITLVAQRIAFGDEPAPTPIPERASSPSSSTAAWSCSSATGSSRRQALQLSKLYCEPAYLDNPEKAL